MKCMTIAVLTLSVGLVTSNVACAQGAVQAVRNAAAAAQAGAQQADGAKTEAADGQAPLTAGPADSKEVTAPGKIDADAPREFTKTASGLAYRILRKGSDKKPTARDSVVAHYKGWLDDKTIFDSSYRRGEPIPVSTQSGHPRLDRRHAVCRRRWHDRIGHTIQAGLWRTRHTQAGRFRRVPTCTLWSNC